MAPIGSASRFLTLIIVPKALRRIIFNAFHCTPMEAHMKTIKTLLRIRLRFIWPGIRKNIFDWVRGCLGCFPAKRVIRKSSELLQSWPITTPFAIISMDPWQPGEISDYTGRNHLLNCMYDMTQFFVSVATEFITTSHLVRLFIECVLFKFGLCCLIVFDTDNKFKGVFVSMADSLSIRMHVAAARNHKAVGVERFHKFLNHATIIFSEERGSAK